MDSMRLMGIDIGAGSLKTMIVSADGAVQGSASATLHTRSPHPGWSEQDPAEWWQAVCDTVPRALAEAGIRSDRIAAVAFSAGAHSRPIGFCRCRRSRMSSENCAIRSVAT